MVFAEMGLEGVGLVYSTKKGIFFEAKSSVSLCIPVSDPSCIP